MTSARLREQLEHELPRLHARGEGLLVEAFLALDHGGESARIERYVEECRRLARDAAARGAEWLAAVLRYFAARSEAFTLDRPASAFPALVDLLAELESGARRGGMLSALVELELLRACHKIDAPGFRSTLVAGLRALWPRVQGDLGPCAELLDVMWRTGWWCRDAGLMAEARRLATSQPRTLRFSAGYWQARERSLAAPAGAAEAVALLDGLLADAAELEQAGAAWRHYLEVELARNEAEVGRLGPAEERLARVASEWSPGPDPMLRWDHAIASAAVARARGAVHDELAAWTTALDVVAGLGTDRLEAEFALALGRLAVTAPPAALPAAVRDAARRRASERLGALLPGLRSAADLAAAARALPGLCS